ncbi:transglycosylase domain-containing protein [Spirillospora sp. CA-294931]|uniref:transglycosylase domain-containing protein n=1 Tax=Spirillospora sp. CA-294931 TaxID=3240042 RepID=UPI003D9154B3
MPSRTRARHAAPTVRRFLSRESTTSRKPSPQTSATPASQRFRRSGFRWVRLPGRRTLVALGSVFALVVGAFVVMYVGTPVPTEPQAGADDEGTTVYYADGRTPLFRIGANREVVRYEQIPGHLRWAVLAAEDRGYYGGHGVSAMGTIRAMWKNASGGEAQGGSTITQQLARNYYKGLSRDRTAGRKIKEIFIALKLNRHRSKEDILALYLNTIYFGRQTSGVQAAARAYFDKDVWSLDVAESALLAAMIQRPAYFKTRGNDAPARALRARWKYVLDGMVSMGRLSRAEAGRQRFPVTRREWRGVGLSGQNVLVRQRIMDELRALDIPAERVVNGRLKIHTGLDQRWMSHAERAMREAREPEWPKDVRRGLIAVDPRDGAIKAFHNGDPSRNPHDSVFAPVAQAGSTFKPYVLAAALRRGYNVHSKISGKSPVRFAPDGSLTPMTAPGYRVDNDEKIGSVGTVDLVKATALSVNTGYVRLAFEAGLGTVLKTAQDLGVPEAALRPFKGQAGVALGVPDVSAVTQAAGYAAFANGGTAVTPHLITKIVDARGRAVPLPWDRPGKRVLGADHAAQVTHALRAVVEEGTGAGAALPVHPVAGKTGTTDGNRSAWFVGYTPRLSAAVVTANAKAGPLKNLPGHPGKVSGDTLPTKIWRSFMEKVTADLPPEEFPEPAFSGTALDWSRPSATTSPTPTPATR